MSAVKTVKYGFVTVVGLFLGIWLLTITTSGEGLLGVPVKVGADVLSVSLMVVTSILLWILAGRLAVIYRERRNELTLILLLVMLFNGAAAFLQAAVDLVDIPSDTRTYLFWTNAPYFFTAGSTFFLAHFILEIFYGGVTEERNSRIFAGVGVMLAVFIGFIIATILAETTDLQLILFGLLYVVATVSVYSSLTVGALKARQRIREQQAIRGVELIGASGLCLNAGFVFIFVRVLMKDIVGATGVVYLNWAGYSLLVAGAFLLFYGLVHPMKRHPSRGESGGVQMEPASP